MAYTITKLAKLSGVSARTLRFYDEIGLLKPAYSGENQYRYYEEEQLLMLQQILFFRELGFPLGDIQRIMHADDFDKIASLQTHKSALLASLERSTMLIKTIDKTISHLRGEITMNVEEFFDPIRLRNATIQKEYDAYMVSNGILSQEELDNAWEKLGSWTQAEWDKFKGDGDAFYRKMTDAMKVGLEPHSAEIQNLVHNHYLLVKPLWPFNKASYLKLSDAYRNDANFHKFCAIYDEALLNFLVEAMEYYANHRLN